MDPIAVGIVGCGKISDTYFEADETFEAFDVVSCGDLEADRAEQKATEYGVQRWGETAAVLEDPAVEVVLNLTPPAAHASVLRSAIEAGKHVYTEKPLAASTDAARDLLDLAAEHDRRVGCAPDTVLGNGVQTARRALDDGRIGDPIGATAFMVSGGHESWHPNPDLYYDRGGGPLFDMGPYYLTALVHLLGPAERIAGMTRQPFAERTITSEPRAGETIDVEVPTHETGCVDFAGGATATLLFTFDVPTSEIGPRPAFEVHGTEGTMQVPNPNRFEGPVRIRSADDDEWAEIPLIDGCGGQRRGLGLVDMARSLRGDWTHRTNGEIAYHVLEIMEGVRTASEKSSYVTPSAAVERPPPVPPSVGAD